jgi:hypothetical protein
MFYGAFNLFCWKELKPDNDTNKNIFSSLSVRNACIVCQLE